MNQATGLSLMSVLGEPGVHVHHRGDMVKTMACECGQAKGSRLINKVSSDVGRSAATYQILDY